MAQRGRPASARVESEGEKRLWNALLLVGGASAVLLLGLEIFDVFADAGRPALRQNDIFSALGSVAMLLIVGVIAGRREQLRRQAAAGAVPARAEKRAKKRGAAGARRKGRA